MFIADQSRREQPFPQTREGWGRLNVLSAVNLDVDAAWEDIAEFSACNFATTTAAAVSVVSASGDDAAGGTGITKVKVRGLDASYNLQTATIVLAGATPVTSGAMTFLRVLDMWAIDSGSGGVAAGAITATITAVVSARIALGFVRSETTGFTVPAGYRAYICGWSMSQAHATEANQITGKLEVREPIATADLDLKAHFMPIDIRLCFGQEESSINVCYPNPVLVEEKADIRLRAISGNANCDVAATLILALVRQRDV